MKRVMGFVSDQRTDNPQILMELYQTKANPFVRPSTTNRSPNGRSPRGVASPKMAMTSTFSSTFRSTLLSNNNMSATIRNSKSAANFKKGKFHRNYTRDLPGGKVRLLSPVLVVEHQAYSKTIETTPMLRSSTKSTVKATIAGDEEVKGVDSNNSA